MISRTIIDLSPENVAQAVASGALLDRLALVASLEPAPPGLHELADEIRALRRERRPRVVHRPEQAPDLLTVEQVAEKIGQHPEVIRRRARAGKIPGAHRLPGGGPWRIPSSALAAVADAQGHKQEEERRSRAANAAARERAKARKRRAS
jgi:hypothetical protein